MADLKMINFNMWIVLHQKASASGLLVLSCLIPSFPFMFLSQFLDMYNLVMYF